MKRISVTDSARVDRVARGTFSIGRLGRCLAIPLLVSCGGCFVHKPALDRRPISETLPEFQEAEAEALSPSPAYWWEAFGDPELDDLVRRALDSNLDLQSLAARIAEAAAVARRTGAPLFPTLDVAGEYAADWIESEPRQETSSLGLLLGWELDLWGRIRSARRAAILDTEAAAEDWLDARVLLSASVAETYFEIREERLQRALLEEQIAANETLLDLTRLRFGQGQASVVDVLQQREQLAATRALVPDVEARAEALEYALDVLLGEAPGSRERIAARPLDAPPSLPEVGFPSTLLESRPDLRAAKRRIEALDWRVGEAIADRLPRFVIGASFEGAGTPGLDTLVGSALANAVLPLFDAGARVAEVDVRRARLEAAIAAFSQDYLEAVRDVETALVRVRKQSERVVRLEEELAIARELLSETRNRYSQGLTDYLPVLDAVVTVQELERSVITSRRLHLGLRVALHRALGGPMRANLP